jgi:hypothetical protein
MFTQAFIDAALRAANTAEQRRSAAAAEQACRVEHPHDARHRKVKAHHWRGWQRWLSSNFRRDAISHDRSTGAPEGSVSDDPASTIPRRRP